MLPSRPRSRWRPPETVSTDDAAFEAGVRALARREMTTAELDCRLERAGFGESEREHAIARLRSAHYLDDDRASGERARVLADRGLGDAAIADDLARRGVPEHAIADALARLEPEIERARRVVAALGRGARTAPTLIRKGFGEEAVETAMAEAVAEEPRPPLGCDRTIRHFACIDALSESEP
jgi:SOS response regulatory protein OraA/RecX